MPDLLSKKLTFSKAVILKKVKTLLNGLKPDVIVGISMGGLLAPHLASQHPGSKLILIATVPYFKTKISLYNFLVRLEARDKNLYLVRFLRSTPRWLFRSIYKFFNKSKDLTSRDYHVRADENYDGVFGVSIKSIGGVLRYVSETDNTNLLRKISNKTIIFSGRSDSIMPVELSYKMRSLIKNSKIIVADRLHYDVFNNKDFRYLDEFLR